MNVSSKKKRKFNRSEYTLSQWIQVINGIENYKRYGNIEDLDPEKCNSEQMSIVSLGRGTDNRYGNINDLDPEKVGSLRMESISLERGKSYDKYQ